jgi:ribosomal protein S18 acetylase RimI-like enzyme
LSGPDSVTLRPAVESDRDFLQRLFASTRERELAFLAGNPAAKALFISGQFAAQRDSYLRSFPEASHDIIEVNGVCAGRLYVDRGLAALHLIDISLLPEYRGRGIGSKLLRALLAEAAQMKGTIKLSVAESNPAQRWYQRLGFETVGSDGMYSFLVAGASEPTSLNPS